jgi:hypothetical protein
MQTKTAMQQANGAFAPGYYVRMKRAVLSFCSIFAGVIFALAPMKPAYAGPAYLEFGGFLPSDTPASAAMTITDEIPFVPIGGAVAQISGFIPLLDGRYAVTGEVRTPSPHGAYFGVGAGVGRLNFASGLVVDAIAGLPTGIPNVSVALRFYASTSHGVGTAGFAGLRIRM